MRSDLEGNEKDDLCGQEEGDGKEYFDGRGTLGPGDLNDVNQEYEGKGGLLIQAVGSHVVDDHDVAFAHASSDA